MTDAEKDALAIYETIAATSKERPTFFHTVAQMLRETAAWKEKNPALVELGQAEPRVLLAFLNQSFDWLRAEAHMAKSYSTCHTLAEGIQIALSRMPTPLPTELVLHLVTEYCREMGSMAHIYFPIQELISRVSRDQVTDEIRSELRKLHLRLAPSPIGKVDERTRELREQVGELIRVEGEKQPDAGRGPWSQIVFDEIQEMGDITRAGWGDLLEHCRDLEQTIPGARWKKRARELVMVLGEAEVAPLMLRWLRLGPTPGQPPEARSPIEDSAYQKGVVWCVGLRNNREAALAIADFGIACLRKIPMLGAVSQKVGFACVQALGDMECNEAVTQLTRLRARVKYSVARRLIEKSLQQAAERSGLSVQELEDISVGHYGLNAEGAAEFTIGNAKAIVRLCEAGRVAVAWQSADGKPMKAVPTAVKKAFPKEVRSVSSLAKELEQVYLSQRIRLESSFISPRGMPLAHWRQYFVEHPLLGFLGRNRQNSSNS